MIYYVLAVLAVLIVFFIIVTGIDSNRFVTREYTVESDKVKDEITLVLLADLHNKEYGKENEKLLHAIRKASPHLVLAAGDILTAKPGKGYEKAARFMESVAEEFPVCYGIGNHEYRMKLYKEDYGNSYEEYTQRLEEAGIRVLDNKTMTVCFLRDRQMTKLQVSGLSIGRSYYRRFKKIRMEKGYVDGLVGRVQEDAFHILIAHNPEYFDTYADWGADLVVSGHIHGGIMRLPLLGGVISPKLVLFPKYDGGRFYKKHTQMILSRGLGMHTIPIRIFNPAELVIIRLKPKKKEHA